MGLQHRAPLPLLLLLLPSHPFPALTARLRGSRMQHRTLRAPTLLWQTAPRSALSVSVRCSADPLGSFQPSIDRKEEWYGEDYKWRRECVRMLVVLGDSVMMAAVTPSTWRVMRGMQAVISWLKCCVIQSSAVQCSTVERLQCGELWSVPWRRTRQQCSAPVMPGPLWRGEGNLQEKRRGDKRKRDEMR
jgi:hypothetical protein